MLTKKQKRDVEAMHGAWIEKGNKLTGWICPHCKKVNATRRPKSSMVSEKGYWDSVRECIYCSKISFVCVYPSGKTKVSEM